MTKLEIATGFIRVLIGLLKLPVTEQNCIDKTEIIKEAERVLKCLDE